MTIQTFPLAWRWTQLSHTVLPQLVLDSLHPIDPPQAEALWLKCNICVSRFADGPLIRYHANDSTNTREWLKNFKFTPDGRIFIIWDKGTALSVPWSMFIDCWDDFLYPTSDDAFVYSNEHPDLIVWRHFEEFQVYQ